MVYSKEIVREWLDEVAERAKDHPEWVDVFERCYTDTLDNTVEILEDGSTFVLTGDIPAMWLRDSTAQLRPYLHVAKRDPRLRQTIAGLVKRQMTLILKDPYANSFNIEENWKGHHETDHTDLNGWIWERKYEVDSLCYPLQLAYLLWKETGETSQFDETFVTAAKEILHLWTVEQDHNNSPYRFVRDTDRKEDTLVNDGFGPDFAVTGMTWSAFRPSDDCCQYSYLIPSNMFAVVVLGYVQEIFATLDLADSESIIADAKRLQAEIQEGNIRFEHVSFSYDGKHQILDDISFTVNKGETIAFVGHTGSGKSSIINVLMRFYEFQSGQVLLDGVDIREYSQEELRKNIGLVLQEPFLYHGTIKSNIVMYQDISDDQVKAAAEFVDADSFIQDLPLGYDAPVSERGSSFSTGQRQLLAFARTVASQPKILILDEATANIDSETEALVQNSLAKMRQGRTTIAIAHRLSTIQDANCIYVLDKGRIIESGTHEELLALGGTYHKMYSLQAGAMS